MTKLDINIQARYSTTVLDSNKPSNTTYFLALFEPSGSATLIDFSLLLEKAKTYVQNLKFNNIAEWNETLVDSAIYISGLCKQDNLQIKNYFEKNDCKTSEFLEKVYKAYHLLGDEKFSSFTDRLRQNDGWKGLFAQYGAHTSPFSGLIEDIDGVDCNVLQKVYEGYEYHGTDVYISSLNQKINQLHLALGHLGFPGYQIRF